MIYLLLGSSGIIGSALIRNNPGVDLRTIPRHEAVSWAEPGGLQAITTYLRAFKPQQITLVNAVGLVSSAHNLDEHIQVNFHLPFNLMKFSQITGVRVVTFGSILEKYSNFSGNAYLLSKKKYFDLINQCFNQKQNISLLHLQLHSLYGGRRNHPHMFISQICECIKSDSLFELRNPNLRREFHHVDDEAIVIWKEILRRNHGIMGLTNGKSVTLNEVSSEVFSKFNKSKLLSVVETADCESTALQCPSTEQVTISPLVYRDTISGVIQHVNKSL